MDALFSGFAVLVFAAVILVIEGGYLWWTDNFGSAARRISRRLNMMSDRGRTGAERLSILKQRRYSKSEGVDRLLHVVPLSGRLDNLLVHAGVKWSVAQFMAWSFGLLCIGALLAQGWVMPMAARCVIVAGFTSLPLFALLRARKRRLHRIELQLPEVADFLARAMRAGHSFTNVLQMVGTDMPEPLAGEFRIAHEEINYGVPMHEALTNLGMRVPLTDLRYLVIAVLIQREAGGNLAEILSNISHIIRERLKLVAKVRVLSAEGRMSAWVLGLLPFGTAGVMMLTNPAYISVMWTDPAGITLAWYGVGTLAVGAVWLRKMTHIRI
jgi:tight adherence protein B